VGDAVIRRLLAIIVLALPLLAAAAAPNPVKITSDKFEVDDAKHLATFTGKVVVIRTSLTVWAPKVVVDYGEGGTSNIKSFTASGGVRIKTPSQDATGQTAVYNPTTQLLRLTGNVMVTTGDGKSTVGSPDLVVDLKTNNSVFTGTKGGRVTGIFVPK
jgi:lipopolysaccharide export system protein LptA